MVIHTTVTTLRLRCRIARSVFPSMLRWMEAWTKLSEGNGVWHQCGGMYGELERRSVSGMSRWTYSIGGIGEWRCPLTSWASRMTKEYLEFVVHQRMKFKTLKKGPNLCPMHPYLNSGWHTTWNDALCEIFVESFEGEMDTELPPDAKMTIKKLFLDCLSCLVWPWNELQSFSSEELDTKQLKLNQRAQINTWRVDVSQLWIPDIPTLMNYSTAVPWAAGNMPPELDKSWWIHWSRLESNSWHGRRVRTCRMSSDESELDESTKKATYRIKGQNWRAKVCQDRLKLIDSDRNTTNAHGGTHPGSPPRDQIRAPNSTISTHVPKVRCPENYYSSEWVANLGSDWMVRALKWEEEKDLGRV